jgi:NAD-dependent dihydropyrimidine dehydrogenase PreA subunit
MSKKWYPVINYDNCIECGACFKKCRQGVFKLENKKPIVVFRDGCIEGCRGCQNLCPAKAIQYAGDHKDNKHIKHFKHKKSGGCGCGSSSSCC